MDDSTWWHNLSIWRQSQLYSSIDRPVEDEALQNVYLEVLHLTPKQHRQLVDWLEADGPSFVASVFREMKHDASLHDVLAARGVTLAWVNTGTSRQPDIVCVEVELSQR